jgi:hypothetical protein
VTATVLFLFALGLTATSSRAAAPVSLLPTAGGAPVIDTGSELPFDRNSTPVSDRDFVLLVKRGYRFEQNGRLYPPGSEKPVSMNDFFYVIEEVRSRQRLQALLKIQLIQSRNGYKKKLPAPEREEIRKIARENWHLLAHRTREDLESLFTVKEIYEMKRLPTNAPIAAPAPPIEVGDIPETVPVPVERTLETLAGPVIPLGVREERKAPASESSAAKPRSKKRIPPKTRLQAKPKLKAKPKLTARAPLVPKPPPGWNARTSGTVKPLPPPWKPDPELPVKPLPAPWKKFRRAKEKLEPAKPVPPVKALPAPWADEPPAPAKKPAAPVSDEPAAAAPEPLPDDGLTPAERALKAMMEQGGVEPPKGPKTAFVAEPAAPPPVTVAKGLAPVMPPPLPPPSPPKPAPIKEVVVEYPDVTDEAFKRFLETAPYSKRVKPLLALIDKHVREPERRVAIGLLTTSMPHIVLDSLKAGREARTSIGRIERGASFARTQIALHDGPVLVSKRSLFSGKRVFFLPDNSQFYAKRGLALPAHEAFSRESASVRELKGEWGKTRIYRDGSTRLTRTEHALAGALLNALMRIDGDLRGWVDDFHSRLRAEAVEFRFYRSIKADSGADPELDRELDARYREWFHRPEDYLDLQLNSFLRRSAAEERAMLKEAGVEGAGGAAKPVEFVLPPSDSPAKRAWLKADEIARGDK